MKKYLFGLIVISYVATVIGIPVYLHYCGGELEEISYLTKVTSCCGEEEAEEPADDSCCKNESHILVNNIDFTLKNITTDIPQKSVTHLFYNLLPETKICFEQKTIGKKQFIESPPPELQTDLMLSATFLRI